MISGCSFTTCACCNLKSLWSWSGSTSRPIVRLRNTDVVSALACRLLWCCCSTVECGSIPLCVLCLCCCTADYRGTSYCSWWLGSVRPRAHLKTSTVEQFYIEHAYNKSMLTTGSQLNACNSKKGTKCGSKFSLKLQNMQASVTIMADFCPEFNPPVRWRWKHQTKIAMHINNLVSSEFPNRSNRSARSFTSTLNCT